MAELNTLKTKGRADIARQIAEARDKGDLSENAGTMQRKTPGPSRSEDRTVG